MSTRSPVVPLAPVPPSLFVKIAMRPLTPILNPLMRKLAGRRHVPLGAQVRHIGRTSGRAYVTTAGARVHGDVAVIPLTFGNQSDWAKNVRAALAAARSRSAARSTRPSRPSSWTAATPARC